MVSHAMVCRPKSSKASDWRYKTHLANLPIYFEYQEDGIDNMPAVMAR